MSIDDLGNFGELIAAVATIATLIFLALQIRHSNRAARTSAEIELPQKFAEWVAHVSSQPEQLRIWDLAAEDSASLNPAEVSQFRWTVAELFLVFEAQYFAHKGGILSEASWSIKRGTILGFLENPIIREWWENRMTPFGEEFREEIETHRDGSNITWKHEPVGGRLHPYNRN